MADEGLDPVSTAALALVQELINQMPARAEELEGTELWSKDGTSVRSTRDLTKGTFELVIEGHTAVRVDLWPLLTPAPVE